MIILVGKRVGERVSIDKMRPIAHTGMPNTSRRIIHTSLPPRSPNLAEKKVVKALAELKANPMSKGIIKNKFN